MGDKIKYRKPRYEVCRLDAEVRMVRRLWTWCPSGVFRADFDDVEVQKLRSRRTKRAYYRLQITFRLESAWTWDEKLKRWRQLDWNVAGRLVALWHELELLEDGTFGLSRNWWLSPTLMATPGRTLTDKIQAWGRGVSWVVVRKLPNRPASVVGTTRRDFPDPQWVSSCLD